VLKLSILIAACDEALLEASLISVLQNRPADCEIVVMHDESYQDRYDLSGEVRFVLLPAASGELDRLNRGVQTCQAPLIHVLRCGAEACDGWADAALPHFADPRVAAVAPLLLAPGGDRIEAAGVDYRPGGVRVVRGHRQAPSAIAGEPVSILGPGLDAAFYRAAALQQVREVFSRSVGSDLADVDLALRLARAGYRAVLEPRSRVIAAAKRQRRNPLSSAWLAERLFWRYCNDFGWGRSVASHIGVLATEAAMSVVRPLEAGRVIGRAAGWLEHLFFAGRASDKPNEPDGAPRVEMPGRLRVDSPVAGGRPTRSRRQEAPRAA
jgi:hypothetical protein